MATSALLSPRPQGAATAAATASLPAWLTSAHELVDTCGTSSVSCSRGSGGGLVVVALVALTDSLAADSACPADRKWSGSGLSEATAAAAEDAEEEEEPGVEEAEDEGEEAADEGELEELDEREEEATTAGESDELAWTCSARLTTAPVAAGCCCCCC